MKSINLDKLTKIADKLTKIADKLDNKGKYRAADRVDIVIAAETQNLFAVHRIDELETFTDIQATDVVDYREGRRQTHTSITDRLMQGEGNFFWIRTQQEALQPGWEYKVVMPLQLLLNSGNTFTLYPRDTLPLVAPTAEQRQPILNRIDALTPEQAEQDQEAQELQGKAAETAIEGLPVIKQTIDQAMPEQRAEFELVARNPVGPLRSLGARFVQSNRVAE